MNQRARYYISLFVLIAAQAGAVDNKSIKELELDEHTIYTIPISNTRITTISFPGPISAIDGALITADNKHAGIFQISHTPGAYFFSVKCLAKSAVTNLNVRWNNKTYVLELEQSTTPILSLVFKYRSESAVKKATTPGTLLGLLDKAKAYPLLKLHHPEAVEHIGYVNYSERPRLSDYNDFEVRAEEVFRFDMQDTLVFKVILRNKTAQEILYKPNGFSIRVGERLYYQSISDASGVMPPMSDSLAYFAVTGTSTGGRNDISIKNDFTVLITKLDAAMAATVRSLPLDSSK